jgi:hypothetical protein
MVSLTSGLSRLSVRGSAGSARSPGRHMSVPKSSGPGFVYLQAFTNARAMAVSLSAASWS